MHAYDFAPLLRSGVGFERIVNALETAGRGEFQAHPPYDIEKTGEDAFRITVAVPGFTAEEIELETRDGALLLSGVPSESDAERQFLHRGFHKSGFRRRFQLADYVSVRIARLDNGLLHIDLVRELPEALKPRTIAVETSAAPDNGPEQDRGPKEATALESSAAKRTHGAEAADLELVKQPDRAA